MNHPDLPLAVQSEDPAPYIAPSSIKAPANFNQEDAILAAAEAILMRRLQVREPATDSPDLVMRYFRLYFGRLDAHAEHFVTLYLDAHHRPLACEVSFKGSLSATSVYPREIIRRALALGASAVVFAHNHPSGVAEPSRADENLTSTLRSALLLVDVRVLDHVVVGTNSMDMVSFAQRGLL